MSDYRDILAHRMGRNRPIVVRSSEAAGASGIVLDGRGAVKKLAPAPTKVTPFRKGGAK